LDFLSVDLFEGNGFARIVQAIRAGIAQRQPSEQMILAAQQVTKASASAPSAASAVDTTARVEPTAELFEAMFASLSQHYGTQNWWVRDNKFQLCLEAILSQGTSWGNVGLAINNLQQRNTLTPQNIDEMPIEHIRCCIQSCGRSNQKSRYIKNFVHYLGTKYDMSIEQMLTQDTDTLRNELLAIEGIGQFTCDNILLYAGDRLKIPINNRMKKVLFEHDLVHRKEPYVVVTSFLAV
jgi:endonuclease-3 related protein